ncbi:hypothetical protein Kpol_1033p43 [Vanderwaltozyma polyspora DSM 70294]|uniref:DUF1771 domain-containing protein n=1 Tax=Vanderwaltozyma polyspora (strain ATCC 22028 / DSM 70294 / BCRC 21397 / CBS 2163 / NBRC 10782 / NRRL Y-8283 / UCD 57-17) TaxID=436907 RepID=A7TJ39_VANPO|nr:uncharacterized protein Kpol_1033p43 [Vanderwaltozyma polyspora DSM 70294]EDO17738.1 hypothetical protein Kpol_1033p43 [Vanderwaltozyma polyspora DSM 70294]
MSSARVATGPAVHGINQHQKLDYNHVSDNEYIRLRNLADQAHSKRNEYSQKSQNAYKNGDHKAAGEFSEKAKQQLQLADRFNLEGAEYVPVSK